MNMDQIQYPRANYSTQSGLKDSEKGIPEPTRHLQDPNIRLVNSIYHLGSCDQQDSEKGILGLAPKMEKSLNTPVCVLLQDSEKGIPELIQNIRNFGIQDSET